MERAPALDIDDLSSLTSYLRRGGWIAAGERPRARILPGGVSNKTVLVERDGEAWVLKQALAKLRVPVDWFSDPIRIHREASALRWFEELAPGAAPKLVFEDRDEHVLCMEAVPEPHENWKDKLLDGRVDRDDVRQFGALLGDVHRRSAARLDALEPEFGDRSFFESLRIEPYYLYTAERVPAAAPFLLALVDETRPIAAALTHGDFSPKNVLVYQGRPKLLDYEVAHIGDPAFDLGFSLAHLLSKARHLPRVRNELLASVDLYWTAYREAVADAPFVDGLEERAVRHACACLLARARGRSQLEYLSDEAKDRQAADVVRMLPGPPTISELAAEFSAA
ncbi:MAG: aminoglycoside phosphotransferase family protein [Actinobacteria bacterium]|nr:MAG: aminoglycoside phosphotransferase family protein [Actinomycetota bacterium]